MGYSLIRSKTEALLPILLSYLTVLVTAQALFRVKLRCSFIPSQNYMVTSLPSMHYYVKFIEKRATFRESNKLQSG